MTDMLTRREVERRLASVNSGRDGYGPYPAKEREVLQTAKQLYVQLAGADAIVREVAERGWCDCWPTTLALINTRGEQADLSEKAHDPDCLYLRAREYVERWPK